METHWQPVAEVERYTVLDLIRGIALSGVLLVNLLYFFRISLFAHMLEPSDGLVARFVEFKAFALFSLTFGVGVGVQVDRARKRGVAAGSFLARRFAVLLAFGIAHMTLVSNVDVLTLYAACGLVLIPFLRASPTILAMASAVVLLGPPVLPMPALPDSSGLAAHAAEATRLYSSGTYADQLQFRWHETLRLILPLLIGAAQRTFGLMLAGVAIWRFGVIRDPARYRRLLWMVAALGGALGLALQLDVPLAFAYGAALVAANPSGVWMRPFVAGGRMAFTNYLTQSIVFAVLFYGLGWFGRLTVVQAAALGIGLYAAQLACSTWWLARHRFGPFEWAWRSLTYGRLV